MTFKAAEAEREMYGGSIDFMLLQMVGSFGPYLFSLIGGGIIIAITAFLTAYEKRNDLTSQLIHTLSNKDSDKKINVISPQSQQTENTLQQDSEEDEIPLYEQPQNERLYWNG